MLDAGMSDECLGMVHDALARYIPMDACPPMMYEDAIRTLAQFMFWQGTRSVGERAENLSDDYPDFEKHRREVLAERQEAALDDLRAITQDRFHPTGKDSDE